MLKKLEETLFKKFKKETPEQLTEKLENMSNQELMDFILETERLLRWLEENWQQRINFCFCFYKSHSNFIDKDSIEEMHPFLHEMVRKYTIEYLKEALKYAKNKLKENL